MFFRETQAESSRGDGFQIRVQARLMEDRLLRGANKSFLEQIRKVNEGKQAKRLWDKLYDTRMPGRMAYNLNFTPQKRESNKGH